MGDGTNPRDTPHNRKVNEVARLLMEAWDQAELRPITFSASYVATFADMARAVVDRYELDRLEEVQVRDLQEGDVLSDGREVKGFSFGSSTHDPALLVWFMDGTHEIYFTPTRTVRRLVK